MWKSSTKRKSYRGSQFQVAGGDRDLRQKWMALLPERKE
jgi:hypothetical protein